MSLKRNCIVSNGKMGQTQKLQFSMVRMKKTDNEKKIVLEFSNTKKCCNFATQTIMKM
jgi:hypothetical protein